jgi:F-type H+-transporting ATPase subunit b
MHQLLLAAGGEAPNPVLPNPAELIIGLIAFGILLFIMAKKVVPAFEKLYAERTEKIEGGIARAERMQAEAQVLLEQYKAQLAEARAEAARIRDDARLEGRQIVEEMRAAAQAEADRIVTAGQAQLEAQRTQIVAALRAELGTLAVDLAERVVGESLADEARRRRTVDRFLDELDAVSAPVGE